MRNKQKCKYWSLLAIAGFAAALLCGPSPALAQVAPPLGVAHQFAVLGAAAVTGQTGGGAVINGDVGSSPTASISNFPPSSVLAPFVLHLTNDSVVQQAKIDATTASAFLLAQGPGTTIPDELGGTALGPGVYSFVSGAANIAAGTTFTLNGAGTYIFLVGSSITANVNSIVNLINGASPCNVFWRVQASATLNGNNFPGTVIAGAAVTVGDNDILTGRAIALVEAVTMPGDGGTTIGGCSGVVPPVPPPGGVALSKAFLPATINPGGVSTLTITLSNAGALATLSSPLTDTLPSGVVIASPPNAGTTCGGGVVSATAGGTTVSLLAGATIPAISGTTPGTCTVTVDVTAPGGFHSNTLPAGALQTDNGPNVTAASAILTGAVLPPAVIPTLSEWAQLGMVLILVGVAVWHLRRRRAPVSA